MKAFKLLPVMAAVSLALTGCGSASKSSDTPGPGPTPPPPVTSYTWQMVQLYVDARTDVASGCAIFADKDGTTTNEVITARVANQGYKVLYHSADGSVTKTVEGSQIPDNGRVTILKSDIPANGYVSVEEQFGLSSGNKESFMYTVQADLMRDMVINVRQDQATQNACYAGDQYKDITEDSSAVITLLQEQGVAYYQTSSSGERLSGQELSAHVPVKSDIPASENVLVVGYGSYASGEPKDVSHYAVVDKSKIYDNDNRPSSVPNTSLTDENLLTNGQLTRTGITLSSTKPSGVKTIYGSKIFSWQPVYSVPATFNISYVDNSSLFSNWTVELNGSISNSWKYYSLTKLDDVNQNIVAPPAVDFSSTTVSSSCTGNANYCLNSTLDATKFTMQRTHLRAKTNKGQLFYQTIISPPNSEQPFMRSSTEAMTIDNASDRIEVSLTTGEVNETSQKFFVQQYLDVQKIIAPDDSLNYLDVNGLVTLPGTVLSRKKAVMGQDLTIIDNHVR